MIRSNVAFTSERSANAASRATGSKSAILFHSARYGEAGLLCLEGYHPAYRVGDVECLTAQEQLPVERGPVEAAGGDARARDSARHLVGTRTTTMPSDNHASIRSTSTAAGTVAQ